ncbi:MAG: glycosyltransferase [Rhodanobacter sp.]|nr:glycosyltransferase [Rhodanobacter sp.]
MITRADRILLVLPSLERGGGEHVLLQLARSFLAAGREVHVAALLGGGALRSDVPDSVVLHELVRPGHAANGFALARRAFPGLVSLLRAIKPDAVMSTMTGTNLLTTMACMLAHGRARLVLREASSIINVRSALKRQAMRWLYRKADVVVAVSNGVADDLGALGVPSERIRVIHNPVDRERLRHLASIGPVVVELEDTPYVIALGRLTAAKDYPTLLQAYAASKLRLSHRLVIVGEGEQRATLERMVRDLGISDHVLLPGALDNPFRILAGAALLVLSSRWEGYPNVLLEALALNVPVVSTDCRHGPRELLDDGRYGGLVPVGNSVALAHAMDRYIYPSELADAVIAGHNTGLVSSRYLAALDDDL